MSVTNEIRSTLSEVTKPSAGTHLTLELTPFDQRHYRNLIAARAETVRRVIAKLKPLFRLSTALDAGCGVGFFTKTLDECGLAACGFDGRGGNIAEARKRFPDLAFETADIEERTICSLGRFDFVLCCGLLYHLENPLRAIRHLHALTGKCLLLESMCIPDEKASLLLREEPRADDQSLTDVAWYPSEGSLAKMLYRAGFANVYRITPSPNHEDFRDTADHARRRTVLLASHAPIDVAGFRLYPEARETRDPWKKQEGGRPSVIQRIRRFATSSTRRQYITTALRARRIFPEMPIPLRLPFGAWWLAEKGALDHELMYNGFEEREMRLVEQIVCPGMTVVDIGAHHGLYTLLASKLVGRKGRVLAFEPSPRECRRLVRHIAVNGCRNVSLEECALADVTAEWDLFVVENFRDWGNSLRPPAVEEGTRTVRVPVRRLDDVLAERGIESVDFIKLDAEGAELSILRGAQKLLQTIPRPVILAEVQDARTSRWGYAAREITQLVAGLSYRWFSIAEGGELYPVAADDESYDANLVAIPEERVQELGHLAVEQDLRQTEAQKGNRPAQQD
jgi:FkbM family methyltransferase